MMCPTCKSSHGGDFKVCDRCREKRRARYAEDPTRERSQMAAYVERNRDEVREKQAEWHRAMILWLASRG